MKKVLPLVGLIFLVGCTSLQIPAYIQDKHPYAQRFYADHGEVVEAVKKSLHDVGWEVEGTADPLTYEETRLPEPGSVNILLYSPVRQTPMLLWTTYRRVNVVINSKNKVSDVEVRYTKINLFPFKQFKSFRNDKLAKRILQHITDYLNQ